MLAPTRAPHPFRNFNLLDQWHAFNGQEKPDEIKGVGLHYSFKAREYGPVYGRFWSVDPVWLRSPYSSTYAFSDNSPIVHLDPDGRLKLLYTDRDLANAGLTRAEVQRFERIVRNIKNLVVENAQVLEVMSKTTGISTQDILRDMSFMEGPEVRVGLAVPYLANSHHGVINLDARIVKALASIEGDESALSSQVLGTALTLLHEYGHWGDQKTNGGFGTGQFTEIILSYKTGTRVQRQYVEKDDVTQTVYKPRGLQQWMTSPTGERGRDIDVYGFGVEVDVNGDGTFNIFKFGKLPATTDQSVLPSPPSELPRNATDEEILKTFGFR